MMIGFALLSAALLSANAFAVETRHYDRLTNGERTGGLTVDIHADGSRSTHFHFTDRGRGPDIRETIRTGEDGRIVALNISGHSYMGAPVDEKLWIEQGQWRWRSTLEEGAIDRSDGFYLANDGSPELTATLARALLARPDHQLEALPHGSARLVQETSVQLEGRSAPVILYSINGLRTEPEYLWLDEQGELFALSQGSMGLVPEGQAHWLEALSKAQSVVAAKHDRRLAALAHRLPSRYRIGNVNVIDVDNGRVLQGRCVTVADGRIESITTEANEFSGISLDGEAGWLIPGLWDMHTHNSLGQGLLHIAAGVTTVRDLGNNAENLAPVREAFDEGQAIGPRIVAAGVVEGKGPYSAPIRQLASSEAEAVAIVRDWAALGYPQIKIYSSLAPAWVPAVAGQAHALGMRVSGHVPAFMSAEQAVLAGFDEIQHIYFLFLNFLAGPEDDTRTPLRFTRLAERGGDLDLDSEAVAAFLSLLAERGVVVDPTVGIVVEMLTHRSGELSPSFAMIADHLPPVERRRTMSGQLPIDDDNAASYAHSAEAVMDLVGRLHRQGVRLVAGTDALPGFALHRELELYQQAGIPPAAVLRIATLGAAEVMDMQMDRGQLAPGSRADMVLLSRNPLEDIGAVRAVRRVFKGDRWFDPDELYPAVGIRPFGEERGQGQGTEEVWGQSQGSE